MNMGRMRSERQRNGVRRGLVASLGVALLLAMVGLPPLIADPKPAPREIVLVARNMSFHLDGQSTPNPTLRLKAGEQVRIVVRNQDPGMVHDFTVEAWNVATALIRDDATASVLFQAPESVGREQYLCRAHSAMMRGSIEIY
jgi:hypothetical protein